MKSYPKVSILIPTMNRAEFLEQTLTSICAQTYPNLEIILSNNNSSDNTESLVKNKFSSIKYLKQDSTLPMVNHWNFLTKKASGDYIAIYHDDDIYSKDIVEKSVQAFLKKKNILFAHVFTKHFQKNINSHFPAHQLHRRYMTNIKYLKYCLFKKPSIICSSVMYPRWIFEKYKFENKYKSFDYHLWFNILQNNGFIAYIRDSVMYYRKHPQNTYKTFEPYTVLSEYKEMYLESLTLQNKNKIKCAERKLDNFIKNEIIRNFFKMKDILNIKYAKDFIRKENQKGFNINFFDILRVLYRKIISRISFHKK